MAVVLGLAVALTYGAADFLGGFTSRRAPVTAVAANTQAIGLVLAAVVAVVVGWDALSSSDALLSAASGIAQLVAILALYRGLATGQMAVVAPLSAVVSALIPVAWGLARGEEPSALALVGVTLAVFAVALVAHTPGVPFRSDRDTLLLGLVAGVGFGVSFVCFGETTEASGLLPIVIARVAAVPVLVGLLAVTRRQVFLAPANRVPATGAGVLEIAASVMLLVAVRGELLSLVAPVAALYPGSTVVLARFVLGEAIGRERLVGLGLALVALAFIAI